MGIMQKKMETTIMGLCRVYGNQGTFLSQSLGIMLMGFHVLFLGGFPRTI